MLAQLVYAIEEVWGDNIRHRDIIELLGGTMRALLAPRAVVVLVGSTADVAPFICGASTTILCP